MKTCSLTIRIRNLIVFAILIFGTNHSISQQVITFTDGTAIEGFITYLNSDTVKYYLGHQPDVIYIETMNHVKSISPMEHKPVFTSDSAERIFNKKQFAHYKHMTVQGTILLPIGAVLTGFGISALVSSSHDHGNAADLAKVPMTIVTVVGSAGILSGIILLANGVTNMQKYKAKMNGFSFDLKCAPRSAGVTVAYRF